MLGQRRRRWPNIDPTLGWWNISDLKQTKIVAADLVYVKILVNEFTYVDKAFIREICNIMTTELCDIVLSFFLYFPTFVRDEQTVAVLVRTVKRDLRSLADRPLAWVELIWVVWIHILLLGQSSTFAWNRNNEIIINALVTSLCFIRIPMIWVYSHYEYFIPSAISK